ncbi:OLC1v1022160C1 [Oldenlandia corymbosa var. corymbosa]|uniref:OLC1v1022160C1 n=1 Tax=Oldenlandia corymbosa var. corymbosa TaxID=529605 RepID=A0AAV1BXV2_OLDCO|nr:OLC1v1022160C1 [Oldenlandia corymbosa var. corymbosa]
MGLSSSSSSPGNSMQNTIVYSWKFSLRSIPKWLHSEPLDALRSSPKWLHSQLADPQEFSGEKGKDRKILDNIKWGLMRFVFVLIFAAFGVVLLRLVLANGGNQVNVVPAKGSTNPGDFGYQKVNMVVDSVLDDIKH